MQRPEEDLTDAEIAQLITGDGTSYDAGLDLLVDGEWADISELLEPSGSQVQWQGRTGIHRQATLQLRGELDWATARLRPWMRLTNGTLVGTWRQGVFLADTPERRSDDSDIAVAVSCWDKLEILSTPIGRTYRVDAGTGYLAAAAALIAEIDPDGVAAPILQDATAADQVLPAGRVWAMEERHTYLAVINGLLYAVGYRAAWCDEQGRYRFDPYLPPEDRGIEVTYDLSDELAGIVMPDRSEQADYSSVPNEWIFVRDRPSVGVASTAGDGSDGRYVVTNQSDGPTSVDARGGLVRRKGPILVDAVDADALIAQARQIVEADQRVVARRTYATDPNPGHSHFDVGRIDDPQLGTGKAHWIGWTLPLDGSQMSHTVEMVG